MTSAMSGATTIHGCVSRAAARAPERPALLKGDTTVSFGALERWSDRLARGLLSGSLAGQSFAPLAAGGGAAVAVCLGPGASSVAALLAVMKTGNPYVPVDAGAPAARARFVLGDARARTLLTTRALATTVLGLGLAGAAKGGDGGAAGGAWFDGDVVYLDDESAGAAVSAAAAAEAEAAAKDDEPLPQVSADSLCYIMYTSGSTGTPKGVCGTHRGALNRFEWMWESYPIDAGGEEEGGGEVCAQKTSYGFVDSVWETFGCLGAGAALLIVCLDGNCRATSVSVASRKSRTLSREIGPLGAEASL